MQVTDLFFLACVLFVFVLLLRIAIALLRQRWAAAGRIMRSLGLFLIGYAVVLLVVGFTMPRRSFASGQRECFDDWCVAALSVAPLNSLRSCPVRRVPTTTRGSLLWKSPATQNGFVSARETRGSNLKISRGNATQPAPLHFSKVHNHCTG